MKRFGVLLILAAAVVFLLQDQAEPVRIIVPSQKLRKAGDVLRVLGDELNAAADAENFEEHAIKRTEQLFDEHAREIDFPGPNVITRPVARLAIRPVVKAVVRYADKQLQKEEEEKQ